MRPRAADSDGRRRRVRCAIVVTRTITSACGAEVNDLATRAHFLTIIVAGDICSDPSESPCPNALRARDRGCWLDVWREHERVSSVSSLPTNSLWLRDRGRTTAYNHRRACSSGRWRGTGGDRSRRSGGGAMQELRMHCGSSYPRLTSGPLAMRVDIFCSS